MMQYKFVTFYRSINYAIILITGKKTKEKKSRQTIGKKKNSLKKSSRRGIEQSTSLVVHRNL